MGSAGKVMGECDMNPSSIAQAALCVPIRVGLFQKNILLFSSGSHLNYLTAYSKGSNKRVGSNSRVGRQ